MKPFLKTAFVVLVVVAFFGPAHALASESGMGPVDGSPPIEPGPVVDVSPSVDPVVDPAPVDTPIVEVDKGTGGDIIVNVTVPTAPPVSDDPAPVESGDPAPVETQDPLMDAMMDALFSASQPAEYDVYSVYTLDETSAPVDDASVSSVIVSLFGEYTPRTQTVEEHLSDGSVVVSRQIVPGVAGMDWAWISGVSVFSLFLFCLCKMIGGLLKHG